MIILRLLCYPLVAVGWFVIIISIIDQDYPTFLFAILGVLSLGLLLFFAKKIYEAPVQPRETNRIGRRDNTIEWILDSFTHGLDLFVELPILIFRLWIGLVKIIDGL